MFRGFVAKHWQNNGIANTAPTRAQCMILQLRYYLLPDALLSPFKPHIGPHLGHRHAASPSVSTRSTFNTARLAQSARASDFYDVCAHLGFQAVVK
jgi:hypothetical protein